MRCEFCKAVMEGKRKDKRFCSSGCRVANWNEKNPRTYANPKLNQKPAATKAQE